MHSLSYLLLFISIVNIFGQTCDYVQNIPVKYGRFSNKHESKKFLSECLSDISMNANHIESIIIECEDTKLPEIKPYFISNMSTLQKFVIKGCNTNKIHAEAFANLPLLKTIVIRDNPLSHIPKDLFNNLPSIKQIILDTNNISCIADEAFGNLPTLTYINLSNNSLKHMSRSWFTNTLNIHYFVISNNQIEEVPEGMFKGWTKAISFDLSWNAISLIRKEAFKDVASTVELLTLHSNYLKQLSLHSFPESFIRELSVSVNLLNYIPESFLRGIKFRNMNIIGNPFKCSCLERINSIVLELKVKLNCGQFCGKNKCNKSFVPVCASLPASPNYCEESVEDEVTNKLTCYMKKLGYNDIRDWAKQCAIAF